ncbi:MAG: S8 family peptidase, partial [Kofleriaceae bacterium]
MIRLVPGASLPERVRIVTRFGDIATVRLRRGDLLALREHPSVASLKAPRPMVPDRPVGEPRRRTRPNPRRSLGKGQPSGRGAVVGVVDWGCDFTHPNFLRRDGGTRLLALWDQRAGRRSPRPYAYGTVHTRRALDRALASDDPFAAVDYDPLEVDDDGNGTHGTHVLDIAAGVPRVGPGGVAPGADIVFVHLAAMSWGPRHVASSVYLLEAIDFIARVAGERPWVINLSLGSHAGPHDGTTLVEQALDTIVTSGPGRVIVQSCGNYGERPVHTAGRLAPGQRRRLPWHVDTSDRTPNEIEVWYAGRDAIAMNLVAPDGRTLARALPDSHGPIIDGTTQIGRFAHRRNDPNNGDNQASLTVEPALASLGPWQVELEALAISDGRYHVWIERDEVTRGSQSRLARKDFVATTTIGTICNGHHTISVGAYDPQTRSRAWFSSIGPTRDGRAKPDLLAMGVGVLGARSAPADEDDPLTVESGTSMASPYVAGAIAVLYEAAGRPLVAAEVKQLLVKSGKRVDGGPPLIDLAAAVARARTSEPPRQEALEDACCDGCDPVVHTGPLPSTPPAELFDLFVSRGSEALHALHVIGIPGERAILPVRESDIVVRRGLGEGSVAKIGRAADLRLGERIPIDALVLREAGGGAPPGPCDPDAPQPCADAPVTVEPPKPTKSIDEWLALDTPPTADDAKRDRDVDTRAPTENLRWWKALKLDRVKPLRGLDPTVFPNAYANRTLKAQKFLRAQQLDIKSLGRKIVEDGVLGADTLTVLYDTAWRYENEFFRTDLMTLGVATERLAAIGVTAVRKARITAIPLEVTYEWDLRTTADKAASLYEKRHTDNEDRRRALQAWLLADVDENTWPVFEWPIYIDLIRRLYGTTSLRGRGAMLRGHRRAEIEDTAALSKRDKKALPDFIWWRDLSDGDRKQLGVEDPTSSAGERAFREWRASDGDPNVDMLMLFYFPAITQATRLATVQAWMGDLLAAELKRKEQNRDSINSHALHLIARLDESRTFVWEHDYAQDASQLLGSPKDIRTMLFDELAMLNKLEAVLEAFGDMVNFNNRAVAANLASGTKYESDAFYVKYLERHRKKTEQIRKHAYDVEKQEIQLDRKSDRVLRLGKQWSGVAGDVHGIYKKNQSFDRLKPARQRLLCKQTLKELMQLIAEAAATSKNGSPGKETDPKELLETAVNRARDALQPPLGKDDVERIDWEMSVRVTGLKRVPQDGIERVMIEYEIVERINGAHWVPVPCSKRWRTESEFGEELFFIFWEHFTRVMNWIAAITLAVVAIAFLAMSGIGIALVRLAGGARFLLANILISEAIYVITSGGELSWSGFLQAALAGYLQAVGFRVFSVAGRWVGSLIAGKATGLSFQRAAAAWLVTKGVTGGGAFALQEVGTLLTMDLISVMRGGSMSSWTDYLKAAGHGFVMGAVLEIGLGTVSSGLGGALRGSVAHKLASALGRALRETKQLLKGMNSEMFIELCIKTKLGFDDFLFGATQGLARFKVWLRDVIENPQLAREAAEGVAKQIEASAKAFVDKLKAAPGAAKVAGTRATQNIATSFYADIIGLSDIALSDDAIRGLRRMIGEHGGSLKPSDLTTAMQQLRKLPKTADGLLALLGALDKEVLEGVLKREALTAVIESKGLASLIARGADITVGDLRTLLQRGFKNKVADLDAWVAELDQLAPSVQSSVLGAMRTHIDVLSPTAALGLARQNIPLDAVRLNGVEAMSTASSRDAMDALIARAPKGLDEVLEHAGRNTADGPALASLAREPDLAAGLIDSAATAGDLAMLLKASGNDAKFVDSLLAAISPRPSRATLTLENLEFGGLERILRVAGNDKAAARR